MNPKPKTDLSAFFDPEFKKEKYFHVEENLEGKSEEVRTAWKEIFIFAHQANRAGRPYTRMDVSMQAEKYCDIIDGLSMDKVEALFKKVYENNKDEYGIDEAPDIRKVEVFLRRKYDFLYNEVTQATEFKPKDSSEWIDLNNDSIYRTLQHAGFKFGLDKLKSLTRSDFVTSYHPFVQYFQGLPSWDGERDYINELAAYCNVINNDFFRTQFKKMLVRCIGCSLYGKENRTVFTLAGEKQSTGKSTFIRFLNPFGDKYYTEAPLRNNKDTEFAFSENFMYNFEELASANNTDVNRLKAIISAVIIKERKPYAAGAIQQPRRCNFWASTNKMEFLTDIENTRWLIFELVSLDWNYKTKVNIHNVWSQAYALYHNPDFIAQLTAEEAAERELQNKSYEVSDLVKELIKRTFKVSWDSEGQFYSNAEIFMILQNGTTKTLEAKYVSNYMSQLGFKKDSKKINGHPVRGWWAIYIQDTDRQYQANDVDVRF